MVVDGEDDAGTLGGLQDALGGVRIEGHRLFAQHMLAGGDGRQ